ncbi:helix-turn-helix domain-containing protein [Ornithobacterium rhinotracheale]
MKERFKEVLKKYGVKQKEVAQKLGITTQSLGGRISNNPTYESIKEIANAIGCDISELIGSGDKIHLIIDDKLHTFYSLEELKEFIQKKTDE